MITDRLKAIGQLARWLGPWADAQQRPNLNVCVEQVAGITVSRVRGGDRGKWILSPGLHFLGPDDPRMIRFISVLASAGYEVVAPHIQDYKNLRIIHLEGAQNARAVDEFSAVVEAESRDESVFLFSISFGSLLALRAASMYPDRVSHLVTFGGYGDIRRTMIFSATGTVDGVKLLDHDPLNLPILYLQALDLLDTPDPERLANSWREYVRRTWNKPDLRDGVAHLFVAEAMFDEVHPDDLELFKMGVGHAHHGRDFIMEFLNTFEFSYLDPRPYLHTLRAPLHIIHGADDDVIPVSEAEILARSVPSCVEVRKYITGMYGHTAGKADLENQVEEALTLLRMLWALTPSKRSSRGAV